LNRTKEEAKGTATRHRRRCARFDGFDTQEGIPDLTHKCNKSNIIYQKLIKN
jgi:hypothetical protein